MKKLKDIINCSYDIDISGIADDSRYVSPGDLFVATHGYFCDHFDFVDDAIKAGAVAVVCDREAALSVPTIVVENINDVFIDLCKKYYDVSASDFHFIGITGTDGKTTTTAFVQQLLNPSFKTAYIGTLGVMVDDDVYNIHNTVPCVGELYKSLSQIKKHDCREVAMEVSSEALLHKRISGFQYDVVAYTNITEDHLNIHKTLEEYVKSKFELVNYLNNDGVVLINGDDENCKKLRHNHVYSYGFSCENDYVITNVNKMSNFVKFDLKGKDCCFHIESPFLEHFNLYNVTLAFLIALFKGIDPKTLEERVKNLKTVVGRTEHLNFGQGYDIILDYAHTLNGIQNMLDSVESKGRVIVVTGAAGGREREKRPKIGKILLEKSDYVIFTMDDPRNESVDAIIDDMIADNHGCSYTREIDRVKAIHKAFDMAAADDTVLILGKGRDNYMAIGNEKLPYCDYDVIKNYFEK